MSRGVLYVATKQKYVNQAIESVASLQEHNDISSAIIVSASDSTKTEVCNAFDEVIEVSSYGDMRDKSYNLKKTPFEKTLYLDTDTLVLGDLSPVFDLLNRVDIALSLSNTKELVSITGVPDAFPQFNGGVIAYNMCDSVFDMFDAWKKRYQRQIEYGRPNESIPVEDGSTLEKIVSFGNKTDQPSLREAIYKSNVSFATLPTEYNYGSWGRSYAYGKVKIIHGSKRRREVLDDNINKRIYPRIYVEPWYGKLMFEDGNVKNLFPLHERGLNLIVRKLPIRSVARRLGILPKLRKLNKQIKQR